jgi:hypothetical protein
VLWKLVESKTNEESAFQARRLNIKIDHQKQKRIVWASISLFSISLLCIPLVIYVNLSNEESHFQYSDCPKLFSMYSAAGFYTLQFVVASSTLKHRFKDLSQSLRSLIMQRKLVCSSVKVFESSNLFHDLCSVVALFNEVFSFHTILMFMNILVSEIQRTLCNIKALLF